MFSFSQVAMVTKEQSVLTSIAIAGGFAFFLQRQRRGMAMVMGWWPCLDGARPRGAHVPHVRAICSLVSVEATIRTRAQDTRTRFQALFSASRFLILAIFLNKGRQQA
eukprot:Skav203383  [mRNA]  locus=scaffold1379:276743:277775:+ [translate_table: standard]